MTIVGALGGVLASRFIEPEAPIVIQAFLGIMLLAFGGLGVYTALVPLFALFGPNRHLGWVGLPPFVLKLGIVSLGTYLLFFTIAALFAIVFGN